MIAQLPAARVLASVFLLGGSVMSGSCSDPAPSGKRSRNANAPAPRIISSRPASPVIPTPALRLDVRLDPSLFSELPADAPVIIAVRPDALRHWRSTRRSGALDLGLPRWLATPLAAALGMAELPLWDTLPDLPLRRDRAIVAALAARAGGWHARLAALLPPAGRAADARRALERRAAEANTRAGVRWSLGPSVLRIDVVWGIPAAKRKETLDAILAAKSPPFSLDARAHAFARTILAAGADFALAAAGPAWPAVARRLGLGLGSQPIGARLYLQTRAPQLRLTWVAPGAARTALAAVALPSPRRDIAGKVATEVLARLTKAKATLLSADAWRWLAARFRRPRVNARRLGDTTLELAIAGYPRLSARKR